MLFFFPRGVLGEILNLIESVSGGFPSYFFISFEETSRFKSVQLFSVFHLAPLIGKPWMTPLSFIESTESHEISLVSVNRQTSYNSGILRQDYGIIRGLPMNHTRFADKFIIWIVVYRNGPKRAGRALITASDQIVLL